MGIDSEAKDWKNKSRARKSKRPILNFIDLDEQARAAAEIAALAKVFTRDIIPYDSDEMKELPREIRAGLLSRSSQKPTQNEKAS